MDADLVNLVSSVGFPIAVAAYLLIRMDRVLQEMQKSQSQRAEQLAEELLRRYLELDQRVKNLEARAWKPSSRG